MKDRHTKKPAEIRERSKKEQQRLDQEKREAVEYKRKKDSLHERIQEYLDR